MPVRLNFACARALPRQDKRGEFYVEPERIEGAFGWIKTIGGMRRPMLRGTDRVGWAFTFAAAAYNLVCLPRLLKHAA